MTSLKRPERFATDENGIALPVALVSLVAVTLIVTAVVLTSATEVALSGAHQDATQRFYRAEGAIQAYVAQSQLALVPTASPVRFVAAGAQSIDSVLISVSLLGSAKNPTAGFPRDTVFAILAVPVRGGREVVAMVDKVNRALNMSVEGGLVSGDNVTLGGNTTVSDGSDSQICADSVGGKAIQTTPDAAVSQTGNARIVGETETTQTAAADLVQQLFGTSLQSLIAKGDVKFARGTFGNTAVSSLGTLANRLNPQATPYNWGCPRDVFLNQDGSTACELDADTLYLPLVVIDASNSDGSWGTVNMNLSHGQGMVIVYNGNLAIQGNFAYKGVILVEGTFDIRGSGGQGAASPKIEGAVIGLGRNANGAQSVVDNNDLSGSPTLRYNRCAINLVKSSWATSKPFLQMGRRTFGWFEVVR